LNPIHKWTTIRKDDEEDDERRTRTMS
jgi:hypothetical protein